MVCKNKTSKSNKQCRSAGGAGIQNPASNQKQREVSWDVVPLQDNRIKYQLKVNGRESRFFIYHSPHWRSTGGHPYVLYGAGISMHGFAKEAGSFMDFEEAKSSALAKHEEIEAAEANYIRSLNLPTSSENLNIEFRLLRNVFGLLNPELIARLKRVIDDPTPDNWDAACGIILRSDPTLTLWQAVLKVVPGFPQRGRSTDENGFRYEYGGGGICDEIAEKLADKILNTFSEMGIDVEITSGCQDGDDHAWIVVYSQDDAWGVDIPPGSMRSAADITGKRSQM